MVSLNPIGNQSLERTPTPAAKPALSDEHKGAGNFLDYMAALVQPVKNDFQTGAPAQTSTSLAVSEERSQIDSTDSATNPGKSEAARPQKAGDGAPAHEAESVAAHAQSAQLLATLGLLKKSPDIASVPKAQKAGHPPRVAMQAQAKHTELSGKTSHERTIAVQAALQQLQKSPELILMNGDGLKRLGEKLGLAFLSKVSDKLDAKHSKVGLAATQTQTQLRQEAVIQTKTDKVANTPGMALATKDADPLHKAVKAINQRNVSRETLAVDTTERPLPLGGGDLKPILSTETATARLQHDAQFAPRAGDAATHARAADNIRAANETPLMRSDLTRQFHEVMQRAHILVADNQNAQFSVKLFPRELGRMEIDLKLIDGEIRGKIVVESQEVKSEMENFLRQDSNASARDEANLARVDIEVRSEGQNAQHGERTPEADELLQNLVTRAATSAYEGMLTESPKGTALYA